MDNFNEIIGFFAILAVIGILIDVAEIIYYNFKK